MGELEPITEAFDSERSRAEIFDRIDAVRQAKGGRIIHKDSRSVTIEMGSRTRTRVIGGAIVDQDALPIIVNVDLFGSGPVHIRLLVRDALGTGSRIGMKKRYRHALETTAATFKRELR